MGRQGYCLRVLSLVFAEKVLTFLLLYWLKAATLTTRAKFAHLTDAHLVRICLLLLNSRTRNGPTKHWLRLSHSKMHSRRLLHFVIGATLAIVR